jgi:hypothetical protein
MIQMIENERCCQKCRFYEPERGECRRYPPQIWSDNDCFYENFPKVLVSEWCGEFQAEEGWILPKGFQETMEKLDKPGAGVTYEVTV